MQDKITEIVEEQRSAFADRVASILRRLDGGRHAAKRRATAQALAEAITTPGAAVGDIWDRPEIVSRAVYYRRWKNEPLFAGVLSDLVEVYNDWRTGEEMRVLAARRQALHEREWELSIALFEKARRINDIVLFETVIDDQGRTILSPSFAHRDAATLGKAASDIGRRAVNLPTGDPSAVAIANAAAAADAGDEQIVVVLPDNGRGADGADHGD